MDAFIIASLPSLRWRHCKWQGPFAPRTLLRFLATPDPAARLVRLSYLAPDIAQAILDGNQPRDLTADKLLAHSCLPLAWHEQRAVLGFA